MSSTTEGKKLNEKIKGNTRAAGSSISRKPVQTFQNKKQKETRQIANDTFVTFI